MTGLVVLLVVLACFAIGTGSAVIARGRALRNTDARRYIREGLCPECGGETVEHQICGGVLERSALGLECRSCNWTLVYSRRILAQRHKEQREARLREAIDRKTAAILAGRIRTSQ